MSTESDRSYHGQCSEVSGDPLTEPIQDGSPEESVFLALVRQGYNYNIRSGYGTSIRSSQRSW